MNMNVNTDHILLQGVNGAFLAFYIWVNWDDLGMYLYGQSGGMHCMFLSLSLLCYLSFIDSDADADYRHVTTVRVQLRQTADQKFL